MMKTKQTIKVNATLQTKNGYYYVVADYKDPETKKRKLKWLSTGELVRTGSKRERSKLTPLVEKKRVEFSLTIQNTCDTPFLSYAQQWIDSNKDNYSKSTFDRYNRVINSNLKKYFEPLNLTLGTITKKHIEAYFQYLFDKGLAKKTVELSRTVLSNIFNSAIDDELISENPYKTAKLRVPLKIQKELGTFEYLRTHEIPTVLKFFEGHYLYPMVHICINHGLRPGELLGLRWQSIDLENGTMDINFNAVQVQCDIAFSDELKTKTSYRSFKLAPETIDLLRKVKEKQEKSRKFYGNAYINCGYDLVFTQENGKPYHRDVVSRMFKKILERNGFRPMRFYDLRHTCCSLMINAKNADGIPIFSPKMIMDYMGHGDIKTTMNIYAHVEEKTQEKMPYQIMEIIKSA